MNVRFSCDYLEDAQVYGEILFEDDVPGVNGSFPDSWRAEGELHLIPDSQQGSDFIMRACVGAGKRENFTPAIMRNTAAGFARFCTSQSFSRIALGTGTKITSMAGPDAKLSVAFSSAAAEGVLAGSYRFDKYISAAGSRNVANVALESFTLMNGDPIGLERGRIIGTASCYAKDLCNEPGNVINPQTFADAAAQLASEANLDCSLYDEKEIIKFGMNSLWYVGMGSKTPPRLVHLIYRPNIQARKRTVIVGKGITFDSGGLCIKTRDNIKTMKSDKSGACVMLGIMNAVAELKLPLEVHGIAGVAENMPDGGAYRPDDIIRAMNGKTIEILNTDAEGRLTLADALTFASRLEPDVIIDVATLTGAAIWALGKYTAALLCDNDKLSAELESAAAKAGERFHRFAMDDERLREGLKGVHADLRQGSPSDGGGTIIGGMFLREFVNSAIPWAHLDIAATAWYDKEFGVYSRGASAYSLGTLIEYLSAL